MSYLPASSRWEGGADLGLIAGRKTFPTSSRPLQSPTSLLRSPPFPAPPTLANVKPAKAPKVAPPPPERQSARCAKPSALRLPPYSNIEDDGYEAGEKQGVPVTGEEVLLGVTGGLEVRRREREAQDEAARSGGG